MTAGARRVSIETAVAAGVAGAVAGVLITLAVTGKLTGGGEPECLIPAASSEPAPHVIGLAP